MDRQLQELEERIHSLKQELATLRRDRGAEAVEDHLLMTAQGPLRLGEFFDGRADLLVVHNMGRACPYCTLWADGFNGQFPELRDRAAILLVSPDPLDVALAFATGRGWRLPVAVDESRAFSTALGRWDGKGISPGASGLHRDAQGRITRIASADFGPGDDFCPTWPLLDLLKNGAGDWSPRFRL